MTDPIEATEVPRWRIWAERALHGLRRLALPWRLLVLGLLAALLLHALGLWLIPFWPFTTQGTIYVDSPEVYTRERLVNDRYDQDFWLRRQLQLLGEVTPEDLASGRFYSRAALAAGGGDPHPVPSSTNAAGGEAGMDGLVFRDRFQVLSGIRDMIRQQVLENMLDDRHDLTANSIYGLKFDTTVIPGHNTRDRAFVEVTVVPEGPFLGLASGEGARPYLDVYFCRRARSLGQDDNDACDDVDAEAMRRYDDQFDLYLAWLEDVEKRLNITEESVVKSIAAESVEKTTATYDCDGQYALLLTRTLDVVLGLPEKRFLLDQGGRDFDAEAERSAWISDPAFTSQKIDDGAKQLRLQDPWAKYMTITARPMRLPGMGDCNIRVDFQVAPLNENYLARANGVAAAELSQAEGPCAQGLVRIGATQDSSSNFWLEQWRYDELLQRRRPSESAPRYRLSAADLKRMPSGDIDSIRPFFGCPNQVVAGDKWVNLRSGFFNFIDSMADHDAYTYAVFPKNDVLGMMTDMATDASGQAAGGVLGLSRRLVRSRTEPVSIGYGGGPSAAGDADPTNEGINFGWVIAAPEAMQLSLRTQLALVSVPAWTDQLMVHFRTGWLDRRGQRYGVESLPSMPIRLPTDVGALDSIFRNQGWVSPAPRIQDEAMDQAIYVVAGQNARIPIPGTRLWRSTSVTLGAQQADRIRVLPNMEGLIAEFQPVKLPAAKYNRRPRPIEYEDPLRDDCPLANPDTRKPSSESMDRMAGALEGLQVRPVRLRVWTSEGVAMAARPVCVIFDPDTQIRGLLRDEGRPVPTPPEGRTGDGSADGGAGGAAAEAD